MTILDIFIIVYMTKCMRMRDMSKSALVYKRQENKQTEKKRRKGMYKIEELGEVGLRILIYLYKVKERNTSQLLDELKIGRAPYYYRIKILQLYNLVKIEVRGVERVITLTPWGEQVAEKLLEIEKILEDSLIERFKPQTP